MYSADGTVAFVLNEVVFTSTNGGPFKQAVFQGSTFIPSEIAITSSKLITAIGTTHHGEPLLARSTDGGATFAVTPVPFFGDKNVWGVASPTPSVVYVTSTSPPAIYKSTDGGSSWHPIYEGNLFSPFMSALSCGSENSCCAPLRNLSAPGSEFVVLCTDNGGQSWFKHKIQEASQNTFFGGPVFAPGDGSHVSFTVGPPQKGIVYSSTDGGATFQSETIEGWAAVGISRPTKDASFVIASGEDDHAEVGVAIYRKDE